MQISKKRSFFNKGISIPTVFKYIAFKWIASVQSYRNRNNIGYWETTEHDWTDLQISDLQIFGDSGTYDMQTFVRNMMKRYVKFNNIVYYTTGTYLKQYNNSRLYQIFDGSVYTKVYSQFKGNDDVNPPDNWYSQDGTLIGTDLNQTLWTVIDSYYGISCRKDRNVRNPTITLFDISSNPLDITIYNKWKFYSENDIQSQKSGQQSHIEILGSNDEKTWYRLDYLHDDTLPTVNYGLAYTGNLIPVKGDFFKYMDFTKWPQELDEI